MAAIQKIVIGPSVCGFRPSLPAVKRILELKGMECHMYRTRVNESMYKRLDEYDIDELKDHMIHVLTKDMGKTVTYGALAPERSDFFDHVFWPDRLERDDPILLQVVEEMGDKANNSGRRTVIMEIPADVKWYIYSCDEYGMETIHEQHRVWQAPYRMDEECEN